MALEVRTFKHFGIRSWDRDILDPIHEIGGYTSREDISYVRSPRHQQIINTLNNNIFRNNPLKVTGGDITLVFNTSNSLESIA